MAQLSSAMAWLLLATVPLPAQMIVQPAGKSVPQAKTREELDAFGIILDSGSSQAIVSAAKRFRSLFPKSEFYEYACVAEMQAAMDLSDTRLAEETASVILGANSNNPEAHLTLAEVNLAGFGTGTGVDAAQAEHAFEHARAALDRLHTLSLPPLSDSHTWLRTKRSMMARAHVALAKVAIRQGQTETAETELRSAIDLAPSSKAFLLLSQIYTQTHRESQALVAAKKAQSLATAALADKVDKEIKIPERAEVLR